MKLKTIFYEFSYFWFKFIFSFSLYFCSFFFAQSATSFKNCRANVVTVGRYICEERMIVEQREKAGKKIAEKKLSLVVAKRVHWSGLQTKRRAKETKEKATKKGMQLLLVSVNVLLAARDDDCVFTLYFSFTSSSSSSSTSFFFFFHF